MKEKFLDLSFFILLFFFRQLYLIEHINITIKQHIPKKALVIEYN